MRTGPALASRPTFLGIDAHEAQQRLDSSQRLGCRGRHLAQTHMDRQVRRRRPSLDAFFTTARSIPARPFAHRKGPSPGLVSYGSLSWGTRPPALPPGPSLERAPSGSQPYGASLMPACVSTSLSLTARSAHLGGRVAPARHAATPTGAYAYFKIWSQDGHVAGCRATASGSRGQWHGRHGAHLVLALVLQIETSHTGWHQLSL